MKFSEIIDHQRVIEQLIGQLERDKLNSGYLFTGMSGIGKRTLIKAFAAAILCTDSKTSACGECRSCRAFEQESHPDFLVLEEAKNEISVAEMRDFCREINKKPVLSSAKVCFIPNSHKMNVESSNCFLKTLEEPPDDTCIMLRSESTDEMLKTIVSRCQIIRMSPVEKTHIINFLKNGNHATGKEAENAAQMSEGSIGKAITFCDTEFQGKYTWLTNNLDRIRPADALSFSDWLIEQTSASSLPATRDNIKKIFDMLALIFRNKMRQNSIPRGELKKLEIIENSAQKLNKNVTPEIILRELALNLST
ncbi:MAG: DNA polymerase III subunit delta' [Planctomycetota bacterium]